MVCLCDGSCSETRQGGTGGGMAEGLRPRRSSGRTTAGEGTSFRSGLGAVRERRSRVAWTRDLQPVYPLLNKFD